MTQKAGTIQRNWWTDKNICSSNDIVTKIKSQTTDYEKIFAKHAYLTKDLEKSQNYAEKPNQKEKEKKKRCIL